MNLTAENIGWVLLVLVIFVPQLLKSVRWIVNVVKEQKSDRQEAFEAGQAAQKEEFEIEERFEADEKKICQLTQENSAILESLDSIKQCLEWMNESDNLNIKYVIKRSWEQTVIEGKPLDVYEFDLLEHRYAIYKMRGGNSWAENMMNEIRAARKDILQAQES